MAENTEFVGKEIGHTATDQAVRAYSRLGDTPIADMVPGLQAPDLAWRMVRSRPLTGRLVHSRSERPPQSRCRNRRRNGRRGYSAGHTRCRRAETRAVRWERAYHGRSWYRKRCSQKPGPGRLGRRAWLAEPGLGHSTQPHNAYKKVRPRALPPDSGNRLWLPDCLPSCLLAARASHIGDRIFCQ